MNIEDGWRFYTADFSIQASGKVGKHGSTGRVMLVRAPEEKARWNMLSDEEMDAPDCPELYIVGRGVTFEEAIANANLMASHARDI